MNIIIESGLVYFIVQLIFVVVYGLGHPSVVVMIEVATQTYVSTQCCALTRGH